MRICAGASGLLHLFPEAATLHALAPLQSVDAR